MRRLPFWRNKAPMQISKSFLLICTMSCTALLPLRAAEPAAQPSAAPAALPAADSESIAKAREAVQILRDAGLQIILTEHEGGHSMPPQLLPELRLWLLAQLR